MSFFKEFKDDLSQAVTELIPENELEKSLNENEMVNTLEEPGDEVSIEDMELAANDEDLEDNFDDNVDQDLLQELLDEEYDNEDLTEEEFEAPFDQDESKLDNITSNGKKDSNVKNLEANSEVTVITKGTIIEGNITSDGSLEIMGTIHGDIDCLGKLSIIGDVTGNAIASEVYVDTKRLEGCINSEGSVKISDGTIVIGDITASSGVIAGAVKGEIDINGPIVVDSHAIIKGNINAKSVQINNGAVIDGFCSLRYSDVDIDSVFDK
jgi:cytoskeletal protein CcmA (bactofilin family)